MSVHLIRLAGAILGAVFGVAATVTINGIWGFIIGGLVFFACSALSDWIWRRKATSEEIRQELESRARDTSI